MDLTVHEGPVLGMVQRFQPITAYRIVKFFRDSPVSSFNSSVGHVYPMIKRFSKAGLIRGEKVESDSRGTEQWWITERGGEALKHWLHQIEPGALLAHDPLRTKVLSFGMLTHQERIDWVIMAKAKLEEQLNQMVAWQETVEGPFLKWAHDNGRSTIKARMEWLDRILFDLINDGPEAGEN